jgi:hypothetical protein
MTFSAYTVEPDWFPSGIAISFHQMASDGQSSQNAARQKGCDIDGIILCSAFTD